jgi:phosphatidylserine/phosphatidylglycerophosphate/cardiolipin synthase-like enzyme
MYALAISNNDIAYLYWAYDKRIPECLGFRVRRFDEEGKSKVLPSWLGFAGDPDVGKKVKGTDKWPVQGFHWKDVTAQRGKQYWYEIVPMCGAPDDLHPQDAHALKTATVAIDSHLGNCSVYFNRGIISTQAITRSLPKGKDGMPSAAFLKKAIAKPGSALRRRLTANLESGVRELVKRANKNGGVCYCALYELADAALIHDLSESANVHVVLSNADTTDKVNGKSKRHVDGTNENTRAALHKKRLDLTDRILGSGHIGHNKFVVYVDKEGPRAVLTGSTNWTSNGLCAQSNNAILIESPALAKQYLAYWKKLRADSVSAEGPGELQSATFREFNRKARKPVPLGKDQGTIRAWFAPGTKQKSKPKEPPAPADLSEVFELIENAERGVLFLAFIPGSPSIVTKLREVYTQKAEDGERLFVRGAATSPDPAATFKVDLFHRTMRADARVTSVAGISDPVSIWEKELYKLGHAVIHDKILVVDPFTDNCSVVTGSHNLGYKASYSNDENLVVIRGNRPVASAYAAHVLDVYDHYRWRYKLQEAKREGKKARVWQGLSTDEHWQDFYFKTYDPLSAEAKFWSPT